MFWFLGGEGGGEKERKVRRFFLSLFRSLALSSKTLFASKNTKKTTPTHPRPVAQCHSGDRSSTTCFTTSGSHSISLSLPSP